MADQAQLFGNPDGIAALTVNQKFVWDSYQAFLKCFDFTIMPQESAGIVAALLTLSTVQAGSAPGHP